ncbi:nitroreductase [Actinophytocola xinjiangensis]|uniref:Nitroreductase n=1 Tax=Actinophytocola xinjiangensis TaxID=485602 RepID=A0A7Z0WDK4_9PSEU|nr:nitroreductase family protein [Actinophytocola xinjiangensis]OLF04835.1 nitroreductase [Actinophytocola xinjiangensis]
MDSDDPREAIDHALHAAVRAPSVHNTQPWRFVVRGPVVEVCLDGDRVLTVADPDGREARLSCGAALLNLRVALRAAGRAVVVDPLPDPAHPELLATVRVAGRRPATPAERDLADAVGNRTTNRRPFVDRIVPGSERSALVAAADAEGAHLLLLDTPRALETFATLLRRADQRQEDDPDYQAELRAWTTGDPARHDGVPSAAGGPRPAGTPLLKLRDYPGRRTAEREFEQDPLVAMVTTAGDTALDHLRAGQAMQRALLVATSAGLGASFFSQPIEQPDLRAALRTGLTAGAHPQAVLRIGYGHRGAPTPRRPVAEVTSYRTE